MKVLASGDHHFDEDSRFEECVRVHRWVARTAREEGVDLNLSAGDVYERASTPREREAVAEHVKELAEQAPVVITKGNHDRHLDCALLSRLRSAHPIIVEEAARVHYVAGAAIAAMAWPERAAILSMAGSQEAADNATRAALQAVLRGLGDELERHDGPRILLGHFMVDGSVVSTGQPLLGQPINVGLQDLALARARLGVMGHIHKAQRFDVGGAPHCYTGSPFRTDFGQLEKKTVLLATFDDRTGELVELQEIETPATKMFHVDDEWDDGWLVGDGNPDEWRGAELRFRYRVPVDRREEAARAAKEWEAQALARYGAASVKLEEIVITEKRARAPEVAAATTLVDKLGAHWASISFEPGERRVPLLSKASTLEAEDRHAA